MNNMNERAWYDIVEKHAKGKDVSKLSNELYNVYMRSGLLVDGLAVKNIMFPGIAEILNCHFDWPPQLIAELYMRIENLFHKKVECN